MIGGIGGGPVGRLEHDSWGAKPSLDVAHQANPTLVKVAGPSKEARDAVIAASSRPPPMDTGTWDMHPPVEDVSGMSWLGPVVGLAAVGGIGYALYRWWSR